MVNKVEFYGEMAQRAAMQAISSTQRWRGFLDTAARMYKYPYLDQLMIYAQRPKATACAGYEVWNGRMQRYVKRGAKGIALVDHRGAYPKIRYVFDISDTQKRENSPEVQLWQLQPQYETGVQHHLHQTFGMDGVTLPQQVLAIARHLADEYWQDHHHHIRRNLAHSDLDEYDEYNIQVSFRRAASVSAAYAICVRCQQDAGQELLPEDFLPVLDFNTPEAVGVLGTAVQAVTRQVLAEIEVEIRRAQREAERSVEHGTELQTGGRASVPPNSTERHGPDTPGQMGTDAPELSGGARSPAVSTAGHEGRAVSPPPGDRRHRPTPDGGTDGPAAGAEPGTGQTEPPNGVGAAHEQPESPGGGTDSGGADLQLSISLLEESQDNQTSTDKGSSVKTPGPLSVSRGENFRITDLHVGEGGPKEKFARNVEAIELLFALEREQRPPTREEQEVLSRYVGWGGLAQAFDAQQPGWAEEYQRLKELLPQSEYEAARASTLNAHYTSPTVIQAMYEAVGRMGFQGGNILEPSMGVGNFFGMLPQAMQGSRLYGVELDSISGRMAQQLYPQAHITVAGFETTDQRNFYDLAIGNVPFGNYKVRDKGYDRLNFTIHNYFLAKALDQVRPGGIVAFVTSRYTMDAKDPTVRRYLAQRGELLGAIRLPNDAFRANAGTDVVSDILFFQKREHPVDVVPSWVELGQTPEGMVLNRYFVDHPHMVLGEVTAQSTQYGREDYTVVSRPGTDLGDLLSQAIQHIHGTYQPVQVEELDSQEEGTHTIPADPSVSNYSYAIVDGQVYMRENSVMQRVEVSQGVKERIQGMVQLRDLVRQLMDDQLEDREDEVIQARQRELEAAYDRFTQKYGLLNARANAKAFSQDASYYLLCSLENLDENGQLKSKADMFYKRTIRPHRTVTRVETPSEALAVCMGERGKVDLPYMAQLLGRGDTQSVAQELQGVIFAVPGQQEEDGSPHYVTADEYLSGNVREKLRQAERAAEEREECQVNVEALRQAQPKDLTASEIDVRLGATWLDKKYIQRFMERTFETPSYIRNLIQVDFSPYTAEWQISGKNAVGYNDVAAFMTYGTRRANAYRILEDTLNLRDVRIYDTVENADGKQKRVLNKPETTLAQQKQQAIRDAFQNWIWKDPQRREALVREYNERFNATRPREYDGSHITFVGMNPEITLREHQKHAIAHVLYGGNTLLAHEVGAGKSFEMAASAMESKRLGLCHKSMFVVPNHLTLQWANEFLRLYPGANLLVASKKDFETARRKKFCARIATGGYDAVIIGQSQFEKIPISPERQARMLREQIQEIEDAIGELKRGRGEHFTVKQMEKTRKTLQNRLEKLVNTERKDDVITFEQLGVDRLFVDESQAYKNLFLYTKMRNVAGLSTSEAQRSSDMFMKCRYMDELTGGRGVIFASGTPVSNSMTELYTVMRYLQYDTLKEKGLLHFDAWASTFGETTTAIELAPEGTGYRARTRFAKFFNLPELMNLFKEVADIKTADQLHLPVPEAKFETVVVQPSEHQKALVQELSRRAAEVHAGAVDPGVDNMLRITSDGRKLGLDQRLMNPLLPDDPDSKLNACVGNVLRIWEEGKEKRWTQLLFCDRVAIRCYR